MSNIAREDNLFTIIKNLRKRLTSLENSIRDVYLDIGDGSTNVVAGQGLTLTGSTLDVGSGTGITVGSSDVSIDTSYFSSTYQSLDATLTALAGLDTSDGLLVQTGIDTFTKRTLIGTTNRLSVTNGAGASANPTIDISSSYIGQSSITTLGTIETGIWQGTILGRSYLPSAIAYEDEANTFTQAIAMSDNKITGLGAAIAAGQAVRYEQLFFSSSNYVFDSSFEGANSPSNWSAINGTGDFTNTDITARYGSKAGKITASGTTAAYIESTNYITSIFAGTNFAISAYARGDALTTNNWFVRVEFFNASNVSTGTFDSTSQALSTTWARGSATGIAPTNSTKAKVSIRFSSNTAGKIMYVDGVQLEEGTMPTGYTPKPNEILPGTVSDIELSANSVTAIKIAANAVITSKIEAGAITASKISVGNPTTIDVRNGTFNEGDPDDGTTLGNGWTFGGGSGATVETDATFGRVARIYNSTSIDSWVSQTLTLPIGRHVIRGWIKTTSVVVGTGNGAVLNIEAGTAVGTFTDSTPLTGTNGWTEVQAVANITTAGTMNLYPSLGYGGGVRGTAEFANIHVVPSVGSTLITPTAIDSMTITGALIRSSAGGETRFEADGAGIRLINFFEGEDNTVVNMDATSGTVFIKGAFEFGSGSSLSVDDVVEIAKFGGSGGFQAPALVQSKGKSDISSSASVDFDKLTQSGNLTVIALTVNDSATPTTPTGWTILKTTVNTGGAFQVITYRRDATTSFKTGPSFALGATMGWTIQKYEFSGVDVTDATSDATGTGTAISVTTPILAQAGELALAVVAHSANAGNDYATSSTYTVINKTGSSTGMPLVSFRKNLTATTAETFTATNPTVSPWLAQLLTFKAKASNNPAIAGAGKIKIYAKEVSSKTRLFTYDDAEVLAIPQAVNATKINRGTTTVAMGGTPIGTTTGIAHGLGVAPTAITVSCDKATGAGTPRCFASYGNATSSLFDISVRTHDGSNVSGNVTVSWIAMT